MLKTLTSLTIKPVTVAIAGALVMSVALLVAFTAEPAEAVATGDTAIVATASSCTLAASDCTASKCDKAKCDDDKACDKAKCDDDKAACASACGASATAMPVAMAGCGSMASSPCTMEAQAVLAAKAQAASSCSACCAPKDDDKRDDKAATVAAQ